MCGYVYIKHNLEYLRVPSVCSLYCDVTCISLVRSSFSDSMDGLELGPDVLVVDGLELVNELELEPDVLAVDGLELVNELELGPDVLAVDGLALGPDVLVVDGLWCLHTEYGAFTWVH